MEKHVSEKQTGGGNKKKIPLKPGPGSYNGKRGD